MSLYDQRALGTGWPCEYLSHENKASLRQLSGHLNLER